MRLCRTIDEVRAARAGLGDLGFVPTMGALHDGHLTLVRRAKTACGAVAVSVFVNPTQFNDPADFDRYPRTLDSDLEKLAPEGVDLVFAPSPREMYPDGFATSIDVGPVALPLEGASRPGHFNGVATVVAKLINIMRPTVSFFGEKDAQQLAVIRRLAADLNLPGEIIGVPTVREADGLAMSSRNVHLSAEQRAAAPVIHRALKAAKAAFEDGERSGGALRDIVQSTLATEPLGTVEYVSVADPFSLAELDAVRSAGALVSVAVRFGPTRLIDNLTL